MKIGIVGLGLIGGSLGLDFRQLGHQVLGVSRRSQTCEQAIQLGVVDQASPDLKLLQAAEVIFLCTPIGVIVPTVAQLVPVLEPSTILTDVGSVKEAIVQAVTPLWPNFVGGHPMAGKAEAGLEVAQAGLFAQRPYVITPTEITPRAAIETVMALVRSLDSQVYQCAPADHDRAVAWISHLPVMISASLVSACLQEPDRRIFELATCLASSGFRDTSRVGGGNPELGRMMAQYNHAALLQTLQTYRQVLDQVIQQVEHQNWEGIEAFLQTTQQVRSQIISPS